MLRILRRALARLRNRRFDEDLREELAVHEEMKRQELEASGMVPADARAGARRALGNVTLMREQSRRVWVAPWIESVVQDVRYAVRALVRQPVHAITAGLALVLAIGLNSSLFTVLKGVVLDPWPVADPGRVVRVRASLAGRQAAPSVDEFRFWREHATSFSGLVAHTWVGNGTHLRAPGRGEKYFGAVWVSASFFDVLGAPMRLGRGFVSEDDAPGNRRSPLVISDTVWRTFFGSDPAIVGQAAFVGASPVTIVGVLDPSFDGLERPVDLWMPLSALSAARPSSEVAWEPSPRSSVCCIAVAGRLAPGLDARKAREEIQLLHNRFSTNAGNKASAAAVYGTSPLSGPGAARFSVLGLFGGALLLILVLACANVGNLQLARGLARRREIATRMSIGASRSRVVRQLVTEGLVLAGASGALALGVAAVLPTVVLRLVDEEIPYARIAPDGQVVLFTLATCVLACVLFGLAPAFHVTRLRIPLGALDRASTRPSRFALRSVLLATQIATSAVLIVAAALLSRALVHATGLETGFQVRGVDMVSAGLPREGYTARQQQDFTMRLLDEIERGDAGPVGLTPFPPPNRTPFVMGVTHPHEPVTDRRSIRLRQVSHGYFDVLGIPLLAGRMYQSRSSGEAVVNEALARSLWQGENPIGRTLHQVRPGSEARQAYTIVGVVGNAHLTALEEIEPVIFTPANAGRFLTRGGPAAVERIKAAALALDPVAVVEARPLADSFRTYLAESRVGARIAWGIGLLGLALATVGVFGVFAYAVEERRREIGLRVALGAAHRQIVRLLLATSGRAMAWGLAAGLLVSLACGPVLRSYLFGLSQVDPRAYGMAAAVLVAAGALATFLPARRACRVDPAVTLREE